MKSVEDKWHEYVEEKYAEDLDQIIKNEKLKPEPTWRIMEEAFEYGELRTTGTIVNDILPPASRFNQSGREEKKRRTVDRLNHFFDTYSDIGVLQKKDDEQ